MKKPELSLSADGVDFRQKVREMLQIAFGRRGNRIGALPEMTATQVGAAPTMAEHNALVNDVQNIHAVLKAYRDRFDSES